jgi:hypothetical protein
MHSYTDNRTPRSFPGLMGARSLAAIVGTSVIVTTLACSSSDIDAPLRTVGPDSLTLELAVVSPTPILVGQSIKFRAKAVNKSSGLVVANYSTPFCGLQVIVETSDGAPAINAAQGCPSTGRVRDSLPPADSLGLEYSIINLPSGNYRAYAVFRASNGNAPYSATTTFTVR